MTKTALDDLAREMYDLCWTPKPSWNQLGEVTKSVWREYVLKDLGEGVLPDALTSPVSEQRNQANT